MGVRRRRIRQRGELRGRDDLLRRHRRPVQRQRPLARVRKRHDRHALQRVTVRVRKTERRGLECVDLVLVHCHRVVRTRRRRVHNRGRVVHIHNPHGHSTGALARRGDAGQLVVDFVTAADVRRLHVGNPATNSNVTRPSAPGTSSFTVGISTMISVSSIANVP